jgi:hypothetical protein
LKRLLLIPWRGHPGFDLFRICQDYRRRLRMNRCCDRIWLSCHEAEDVSLDYALLRLADVGPARPDPGGEEQRLGVVDRELVQQQRAVRRTFLAVFREGGGGHDAAMLDIEPALPML